MGKQGDYIFYTLGKYYKANKKIRRFNSKKTWLKYLHKKLSLDN